MFILQDLSTRHLHVHTGAPTGRAASKAKCLICGRQPERVLQLAWTQRLQLRCPPAVAPPVLSSRCAGGAVPCTMADNSGGTVYQLCRAVARVLRAQHQALRKSLPACTARRPLQYAPGCRCWRGAAPPRAACSSGRQGAVLSGWRRRQACSVGGAEDQCTAAGRRGVERAHACGCGTWEATRLLGIRAGEQQHKCRANRGPSREPGCWPCRLAPQRLTAALSSGRR